MAILQKYTSTLSILEFLTVHVSSILHSICKAANVPTLIYAEIAFLQHPRPMMMAFTIVLLSHTKSITSLSTTIYLELIR